MNKDIVIYHGSQQIVELPQYGVGKTYNDYGQGFYCTESIELAKEWACPIKNDGYSNKYILHTEGLNVMQLTKGSFHILNWMAILLQNRKFDINNNVGNTAREYLLEHFLPDITDVDIIIGYRADDSYFSFAEDFVNNTISVRDLNMAMHLGTLGEQIVLISPKAFGQIEFLEYEIANYQEYYYKRAQRDKEARKDYQKQKKGLVALKEDVFVLDIIREELKNDDPRLQFHISE
ncbi:MAG: DUF3990 domain-containing protein [Lachnospiraceae bacterium]